jgi:hypothetical protein
MNKAAVDAVHESYRKGFFSRSRATRNLAQLDGIIAQAVALGSSVTEPDVKALLDERLALYRSERAEIAAIQAGGPKALAAWRNVEWSEINHLRYAREFGGKARTTRDLGLLNEMVDEQAGWLASVPALGDARLKAQRDQMEANLKLYRNELEAIPTARAALPPSEQARLLATLANHQFQLYRRHFEGRSRLSRRPALLERITSALDAIRIAMIGVREMGVVTPTHASNLQKVTDRIAHHRGELDRIRASRSATTTSQLARALGDEANKLFAAYRDEFSGKPRATRDLARLDELCDQLQEMARTMQALQNERPDATNAANLGVVLDQVKMTEREYGAIAEAKRQAQSAAAN